MSLEKGISRIGTVSGVLFGIFFALCVTFLSLEQGLFNYLSNRFNEKASLSNEFKLSEQDPLSGFYVDDFVEDKLTEKPNFDYVGAKNAGYSNEEINKYLSSEQRTESKFPSSFRPLYPKTSLQLKERSDSEKLPSTNSFFSFYLPAFFMAILVVFIPFVFGLYAVKGVATTLNWIIGGFRE